MLFLSFLVAFLTGVALGEVTVPFVAIDRKGTRSPTFGRQRVGAPFVDVPLENADLAYLMNISIGTPPQPFTLLLDTGSSTTWVPIAGCGQFCGSPAHTLKTTDSSTYSTNNLIFSVRYGEGFSRGFYAKDTVTLEGGVKVPDANFAVSDFNDGELTIDGADGIIGLGPDILSSYNNPDGTVIPTLVTTMFQDKVIDKNLFSVYFAPFDADHDTNRINGHIVFGGVNSSTAQSGEILYAPITSDANYQDYWAVDLKGVRVNTDPVTFNPPLPALVDTGSTLIFVPEEVITRVLSGVQGLARDYSGEYVVPCDTQDLPPISFMIGDYEFTLQGHEYIVPYATAGLVSGSVTYCYTYLEQSPPFADVILGYGFLQQYVSVFDNDNRRMGFGRRLQ